MDEELTESKLAFIREQLAFYDGKGDLSPTEVEWCAYARGRLGATEVATVVDAPSGKPASVVDEKIWEWANTYAEPFNELKDHFEQHELLQYFTCWMVIWMWFWTSDCQLISRAVRRNFYPVVRGTHVLRAVKAAIARGVSSGILGEGGRVQVDWAGGERPNINLAILLDLMVLSGRIKRSPWREGQRLGEYEYSAV